MKGQFRTGTPVEDALREIEERYRRLVSIMPAAMYTCDRNGLISYYSQRAAELWGREPKLLDPVDKYCGSFRLYRLDGTPLPHDQCPMGDAVLRGLQARNAEILIQRPDGTIIQASVNIDLLHDRAGALVGAINVFQDVTEQKRLWAENQQQKEELENRVAERTRELEALNQTLLTEIEERKRIKSELEEVRSRLMDRVEAERIAIAHEIHDGPIQDLYGLMYRLDYIHEVENRDDRWEEILESIRKEMIQVNQTLRSITIDLQPPTLSTFGLITSIRQHTDDIRQIYTSIEIHLDLEPDQLSLSEPVRSAFYRIYLVVITNVIRHSEASRVDIRFALEDKKAVLEIEDNGRGFELPKRWIDFAREGHLGLVGSFERAESIGGRLEVASTLGKGTRVRAVAPVHS